MRASVRPTYPGWTGKRRVQRLAVVSAAAVAMATAVAACGSSTPSASTGGGQAGSAGTTSITLSMQNANLKTSDPATYAIVQAFEKKYPDIKVNLTGQPVDQHEQQMTIAAQSNTLPDIFWVYNSLAQTMAKNGNLLDLAPILAKNDLSAKFAPSMLAGYKTSIQYGLPYQALVTGLYYNKKILAQYGLQLPATFDQLVNVAKVLHSHGVTTISQGANQSSFSVWAFLTMLDRFGWQQKQDGLLDGAVSYDNADFLRLYQHIQDLAKAGAFPSNMTTQNYQQSVDAFTSGKAAFLDSGVWAAGAIQASPVGNDVGFWAGPTFSDGVGPQQLVMNAPSAPLVVSSALSKDSAKLTAVTEFLQFYYSDAGQQLLVDNAQTPVTTYQPTGAAVQQPVYASVIAALSAPGWTSPLNQPDLTVSAAASNAIYDSIYGVMEGVISPQAALNSVAPTIKSASS
jgi:raffinose/stachyose/melibiose transport system substrate-binding protein